MKKGLLKVLVNICVLASILVVLDIIVGYIGGKYANWLNKQPRAGDAALVNYDMNAATPDVAIIGSSTAICHYVPDIIQDSLFKATGNKYEVFNMGMSRQKMAYNYYALKSLMKRKTPVIVIEDVWASNLSTDDYPSYFEDMRPYVKTNHEVKELFVEHDYYNFMMNSNMYCYNTELVKLLMAVTKSKKTNGYRPSLVEMNRIEKIKNSDTCSLHPVSVKEFDGMIELCKNDGIKLFVVLSPAIRSSDTTSLSYRYMKQRCQDNDIPFLDYSNDDRYYDTHYFSDPLHMNSFGAAFFTSELMKDIKHYLGK